MEEQLTKEHDNDTNDNFKPRAIAKEEIDSVVGFLNKNLRQDYSWSLKDEFPTTFTPQNAHNIHVIDDGKEILSHAAMKYTLTRTPQAIFKVATIGSVVTSTEHRKQGLSSKLINMCVDKATKANADIAILWTNLFDFYRKLGFELTGTELSALIDQELDVDFDTCNLRFHEGKNIDPAALAKLYTKHSVYSVRSQEETRKFLNTPNTRIYTAWSTTGTLQAYAIEGKGADLENYIHEWSGSVSALIPLLAHIRLEKQTPITLLCPRHSTTLINTLAEHNVNFHSGFLGMIKIINPKQVCNRINKYAKTIKQDSFTINFSNGSYKISCKTTNKTTSETEEIIVDDHKEISKLVFGPMPLDLIEAFSPEAQKIIETVLPMDMWVWGWDSI